eukprot:gene15620-21724_t
MYSAGASADAAALVACFKESNCLTPGQQTTWDHLLEDRPSCLNASHTWWSKLPSSIPVTLVTQLSGDRIPQLKAQCNVWLGPIAATMYVPLLSPAGTDLLTASRQRLLATVNAVQELFNYAEKQNKCQLRMLLIHEVFTEQQAANVLYPVNSLRNWARLMADTPLIANIDVDMLPSVTMSKSLLDEMDVKNCGGQVYADSIALRDKSQIPDLIDQECFDQFRKGVAPMCHNATDYSRWMTATKPYSVDYQEHFEPWFMADRMSSLWYDVRYRGYGKNKIVHVAATHSAGFSFHIHPAGFLVHRPHTESKGRKEFLKVKFGSRKKPTMLEGSLYKHIEDIWNSSRRDMKLGSYEAVVDPTMLSCMKQLPWWNGQ